MGSFLDNLFGTGSSANTQAAVGQGTDTLWQGATDANRVLNKSTQAAGNAFTLGANNAMDALKAGYGQARGDLLNYGGQAQAQLGAGRDAAVSTILGGNQNYQPFLGTGQSANTMLANALGLNGVAGNDAATAAFRADPGYAFTRDEAADTTARKMAALGMAGSGNTLDAINRQSANLADQTYSAWRASLGDLASKGLTAASGMSSNNQAAGGVQFNAGSQAAQLSQGLGTSLGSLGTGLGTALGSIQSGLGNSLGGLQQQLGQGQAGNISGAASGAASLGLTGGQAADSAENANAGVLSKLFGGVIGLPMAGGSTSLNPGGLSIMPGANGSYTLSPSASSNSGHGLLGAMGIKL